MLADDVIARSVVVVTDATEVVVELGAGIVVGGALVVSVTLMVVDVGRIAVVVVAGSCEPGVAILVPQPASASAPRTMTLRRIVVSFLMNDGSVGAWTDQSPCLGDSCHRTVYVLISRETRPMSDHEAIATVPANEASCQDIDAIFGTRGYPGRCRCQRFKTTSDEWWHNPISLEERIFRQRQQTDCGYPGSGATSGLVSYLDGQPVGWCAVEPRSEYMRLGQTPWKDRDEDESDDTVWAVACFVVRAGYRRQGLTYPLARAAVEYAREQGARAIEGYPMITEAGKDVTWGELNVGTRQVFAAAGFEQVSHPSKRRVVMRIDF